MKRISNPKRFLLTKCHIMSFMEFTYSKTDVESYKSYYKLAPIRLFYGKFFIRGATCCTQTHLPV